DAHRLARRTSGSIMQNLTIALAAMAVLVVCGLFFELSLPLALVGYEVGSVLVVLNVVRLFSYSIRREAPPPETRGQRSVPPASSQRPVPRWAYWRRVARRAE